MKRCFVLFLCLLCLFMLSGCLAGMGKKTKTSFKSKTGREFSSRSAPAKLYRDNSNREVSYEGGYLLLGEVSVSQKTERCWDDKCTEYSHSQTPEEMLQKEAAEVGGDAVVIIKSDFPSETLTKNGECLRWGTVQQRKWVCDTEIEALPGGGTHTRQVNCRNEYVNGVGCEEYETVYGSDHFAKLVGEVYRYDGALTEEAKQFGKILQTLQKGGAPEIEALIAEGMAPNEPLMDGTLPIEVAIRGDNADGVHALVAHGADPKEWIGEMPILFFAISKKKLAAAMALIEAGADVNRGGKYRYLSYTPIMLAATTGNKPLVKRLLEAGANLRGKYDDNKRGVLWAAANGGSQELIEFFLEQGVKLSDDTPMDGAAKKGNIEMMKYLLALGADIEEIGWDEHTPLWTACLYNHKQAVEYLIKAGANVRCYITRQYAGSPSVTYSVSDCIEKQWPELLK